MCSMSSLVLKFFHSQKLKGLCAKAQGRLLLTVRPVKLVVTSPDSSQSNLCPEPNRVIGNVVLVVHAVNCCDILEPVGEPVSPGGMSISHKRLSLTRAQPPRFLLAHVVPTALVLAQSPKPGHWTMSRPVMELPWLGTRLSRP